MTRNLVVPLSLVLAACSADARSDGPETKPKAAVDPTPVVPAKTEVTKPVPAPVPEPEPAEPEPPVPAGPTCSDACTRAVECQPEFPGTPADFKDADIKNCTANCESDSLSEEDLACWMKASCGAFMARSGALPAGGCQAQVATDEKGENNGPLVKQVRDQLFKATKICEDMKRDVGKVVKKLEAQGADEGQGAVLWSVMLNRNATTDNAWQQGIIDGRKGMFSAAVRASMFLDTPLLTSDCKLALGKAAAEAVEQCETWGKKSPKWLKAAGKDECGR